MNKFSFNLFIFLIIFIFPNFCFAYIDPGNLNIILQGIFGAIAMILAFASIYYNKFKNFILKILKIIKSKTYVSKKK